MWQERVSKLPYVKFLPDRYPFKSIKNFIGCDVAVYSSVYDDLKPLKEIFPDFYSISYNYRNKVSDKFNDFRDRLFAIDQKSYLESLLIRQDKISMSASIETRVPFVHMPLWKVLARLSNQIKTPGVITKPVLKSLALNYLPRSLVDRRKNGLLLPYEKWLHQENGLGRYLELLTEANAPINQYCDKKKLIGIVDKFRKKQISNLSGLLNKIINIDVWLRSFSNRVNI